MRVHLAFLQHVYMDSKTDRIRTAWAAGNRIGALRIAARFFDRSLETKISSAAWLHTTIPAFTGSLARIQSKS
jgi:hypothetical protein